MNLCAYSDSYLRKLDTPEARAELIKRGLLPDPAAVARSRACLAKASKKWGSHQFFERNERPRAWSSKTVVK